jgi:hypothetical protein
MNLNDLKGKVLKELIDASKEEKKTFCKVGEEVKSFSHVADSDKIIKQLDVQADLWFKTTVALTAQAIDLMCPYLYPSNPYRCGTVRKHNFANPLLEQLSQARNQLMTEYLNFTPDETDLYGESVRAINQSQVYGAGLLWTGYDERKGIVHSVYGSIDELECDPDAISLDRANWIARRREKKRWELLDEMPEAATQIMALQPTKSSKSSRKNNDLISYYEVWLRVGIHRYIGGNLPQVDEKTGIPIEYTDQPRKFLISDEGRLLKETTWEAPLFLDNLWPCEMLSYVDDEDSIWPISPMRASLPFQKALNWLYIFYLTKIRFCSRSLFAVLDIPGTDLEADSKAAATMWDDMPFLSIKSVQDNAKISDVFQQLNLDAGLDQFEKAHAIIKREFEQHSGLYDILHYGEGETQDRSATATQFKEKTAKTRINYRADRVKKWQSKVARKEAMVARFIHTPEQINVILGDGTGQIWGQIMPPQEAAMNPMAVSYQQWFLECDYSIESDSMRRHDIQTKIDALKELMNTTVPVMLQSPDPNVQAVAYDIMAEYAEAIGATDKAVQELAQTAAYLRQQAMLQAQAMQQMAGQQAPAQEPASAGGY